MLDPGVLGLLRGFRISIAAKVGARYGQPLADHGLGDVLSAVTTGPDLQVAEGLSGQAACHGAVPDHRVQVGYGLRTQPRAKWWCGNTEKPDCETLKPDFVAGDDLSDLNVNRSRCEGTITGGGRLGWRDTSDDAGDEKNGYSHRV